MTYDLNADLTRTMTAMFKGHGGIEAEGPYEDECGIELETQNLQALVDGMVMACRFSEGRPPYFKVGGVRAELREGKVVIFAKAYWF